MSTDRILDDLDPLYSLIQARFGLRLSDSQRDELARISKDLLASMRVPSPYALSLALADEPLTHPAWQELIHQVTVGETYFFRNPDQFNALRDHVLPALIEKRRRDNFKQLRIWSAGCASGEEIYSMAILLRELLPDIDTWSISLLGTDINGGSLTRAQRGIYRAWSFRNETPEDVRTRWFTAQADTYRILPAIQHMVCFSPLNLVSDSYPSYETGTMNMDVILCRNVTIYFDEATTRSVVRRLHRALAEDGWLVVGHAEPLASIYQGFETRNFTNTVLYQKCVVTHEAPKPTVMPPVEIKLATVPVLRPVEQERPIEPKQSTQPEPDPLQIAKSAADQENWEEALTWLSRAEEADRLQPQIHYLRALVLMHQDNPDGVLASLRRAIYYDPKFALAHYTLGDFLAQRGNRDEAARHWRLAEKAVANLNPKEQLPFAEELTAEMLQGLVKHRLHALRPDGREVRYVNL